MSENIFSWIARNPVVSALVPAMRTNMYAQEEFARYLVEFEMLTGDRENSKKMANDIKEKAVLFSQASTYTYASMFSLLAYESKSRLNRGLPIADVIQRIEQVKTLDDLAPLQRERVLP